ncbi:MAG: Flp pilus assembly protein CpaB [Noviherbaspirillum sp.]
MRNTRAIVMIILSLLVATLAVVLAASWVSKQAAMSVSKVAVAAIDINVGTRLTPEMVRLADWPAGSVPSGSFSDAKLLDTRVAKANLQRGEPIIQARLAPVGAAGGLSAVVAEGKRAMTVRVNDVVGVAGFALPGNFVDILVSTKDENGNRNNDRDPHISKLVLERILVLAVAQEASQNETKPKVVNAVTLEVSPEQAEKLDLARSVGQLSLVLRNQVDLKPTETGGATKRTLFLSRPEPAPVAQKVAAKSPKPVKAAPPSDCQMVMTGAGRITQCY